MSEETTKEYVEIPDWTKPTEDGYINVPDELDSLVNQIGFQYRLHAISKRFTEAEMVCRMAYVAQKFFHKLNYEKENGTGR